MCDVSGFLSRWGGMLLCGTGLVATLALAAADDLTLYIHPRYVMFTVVLNVVGAVLFVLAVWGAATRPDDDHDHHEHHDHHGGAAAPPWRAVATVGTSILMLVAAVALLVVPPATLSAERALTSAAATDGGGDVPAPVLVGSDPTRFSIRDWATILGTGSTANDLVGQRADVTGIVLLDGAGAARIGRYAVTCCTVDAQLFAIAVDRDTLPAGAESGDWVRLTGTFADADGATRLVADSAEEVSEPDDPYIS
ncbi:TIGR03943 family putative permease subunit [Microbacterium sp. NPDC007973]|uniref:TIGR03943 family putative permease subunit n=1 Tax=Microbacterium sp. NPDC007973 TaxID=3364182 RepID=UPI0036EFFF26